MAQRCDYCGKSVSVGNAVTQRGKAKYLGGNGRKTTGISKRKFKPNLQRMQVEENGAVRTRKVCTGCIRNGKVQKPVKRKLFTLPKKN